MQSAVLREVDVSLSVPVPVTGADGKEAERSKLTLRRPKVQHAKRLAALIGADMLDILLSASDEDLKDISASIEGRKLVADVLRKLMAEDRLDGLTALIADLCDEDKATIDNVDLVDLPALAVAFGGFFPKLQSAMSGLSAAISRSSDDTTPAQ